MITFSILLIALLAIAIVSAIAALVAGAGFLAIFGDLILCALIIAGLVKLFSRKK